MSEDSEVTTFSRMHDTMNDMPDETKANVLIIFIFFNNFTINAVASGSVINVTGKKDIELKKLCIMHHSNRIIRNLFFYNSA